MAVKQSRIIIRELHSAHNRDTCAYKKPGPLVLRARLLGWAELTYPLLTCCVPPGSPTDPTRVSREAARTLMTVTGPAQDPAPGPPPPKRHWLQFCVGRDEPVANGVGGSTLAPPPQYIASLSGMPQNSCMKRELS